MKHFFNNSYIIFATLDDDDTTNSSYVITLLLFGTSDILLIIRNGILHKKHTCAILAPSISTHNALNLVFILLDIFVSVTNISPLAIVPILTFSFKESNTSFVLSISSLEEYMYSSFISGIYPLG